MFLKCVTKASDRGERKRGATQDSLKYKKTLADRAEIVSAYRSAIASHQPTLFYFQGPGSCVGIILKFMLTATVKIATSTDMCSYFVSRKYSV